MTNTELKAFIDNLLPDNTSREISPEDLRNSLYELVKLSDAYGDFENTEANPKQSLSAGVWTLMTNDLGGSSTDITRQPYYITDPMFADNAIQLTGIPESTIIQVRFDVNLQSLAVNTEFDVKVVFKDSGGSTAFEQIIAHYYFKNTGARDFVIQYNFFRGPVIEDGELELYIKSDSNSQAKYNGVLVAFS